jgi:hypothetical protein
MRGTLVLAVLLGLAGSSGAQVVRCRDAAGRVTYNDTGCKAGDQRVELGLDPGAYAERGGASGPDRLQQQLDGVERARRLQRETVEAVTRAERPPAGAPGADPRLLPQEQNRRAAAQWRQREQEEAARLDPGWNPYAGSYGVPYGGIYRGPPAPLPDMRPQLRDCNAAGCQDTQGNHYDRAGRLDRYVRPDGRRCRPVGTTVVCG